MLEVAETRKEGKFILSEGKVQVNGKIIKKDDFPVGLMDVISMPDSNKYYRIIPSHKGLILSPISKEEASYRIVRVEDKNTVKGAAQIIFHDGSIMLVKVADPKNPVEVTYETFDVLKITYDKQVVQTLKTREGNTAVITGGKNIGIQGKIVEIEKTEAKKRRQALVIIETAEGAKYQTILDYVFSISDTQQAMATPEANTVV